MLFYGALLIVVMAMRQWEFIGLGSIANMVLVGYSKQRAVEEHLVGAKEHVQLIGNAQIQHGRGVCAELNVMAMRQWEFIGLGSIANMVLVGYSKDLFDVIFSSMNILNRDAMGMGIASYGPLPSSTTI